MVSSFVDNVFKFINYVVDAIQDVVSHSTSLFF